MPKAKRGKVISLTQTKKKTKDFKTRIVNKIHDYIKKYENVYGISFQNMRTNSFRKIQQDLRFLQRAVWVYL